MPEDEQVRRSEEFLRELVSKGFTPLNGLEEALMYVVVSQADRLAALENTLDHALSAAYEKYDPIVSQLSEVRREIGRLQTGHRLSTARLDAAAVKVKSRDVFRYEDVDKQDSIFRSTGDQAIPYCKAYDGAVRTSYSDGSCLYPEEGDTVVTYEDGHRELVPC